MLTQAEKFALEMIEKTMGKKDFPPDAKLTNVRIIVRQLEALERAHSRFYQNVNEEKLGFWSRPKPEPWETA